MICFFLFNDYSWPGEVEKSIIINYIFFVHLNMGLIKIPTWKKICFVSMEAPSPGTLFHNQLFDTYSAIYEYLREPLLARALYIRCEVICYTYSEFCRSDT